MGVALTTKWGALEVYTVSGQITVPGKHRKVQFFGATGLLVLGVKLAIFIKPSISQWHCPPHLPHGREIAVSHGLSLLPFDE